MNARTYAFMAGAIGSAITAWWWLRNRNVHSGREPRERGTVIFDNTPTATPGI